MRARGPLWLVVAALLALLVGADRLGAEAAPGAASVAEAACQAPGPALPDPVAEAPAAGDTAPAPVPRAGRHGQHGAHGAPLRARPVPPARGPPAAAS